MEHEEDIRRPAIRTGLAVTLLSGSDREATMRVAAHLAGTPGAEPQGAVETDGDDADEFAIELAESLSADADRGVRGNSMIVLEPDASVMEVALVFERVVERRDLTSARVGIRDVVAVSSLSEIRRLLFGADVAPGSDGRADAGSEVDGVEDYNAPERLAERLEFASLIVLTDLGEGAGVAGGVRGAGSAGGAADALALSLLGRLAPMARVLSMGDLATFGARGSLLFRRRAHHLASTMGWQRELGGRVPSSVELGPVGAFVFRDPRPFHPERLHAAIARDFVPQRIGWVLRSRGLVRLASRADRVGSWASAGDVLSLDPTGMLSWDADSPIGQEIVFFGYGLDHEALSEVLGRCLLTIEELVAGPHAWRNFADPFPAWVDEPGHSH